MSTYKTSGIILRRINYGEADRIITILTPRQGKVSAIAKGVRRINSKLGSHLELFSEVDLMLANGRNLDIVTSARIRTNIDLTADYERLRVAFLFCEMLDKLLGEHTEFKAYQLLAECLKQLSVGAELPLTELYFKLRLLDQLGYRPNLEQCMQSQEEIQKGKRYFFSYEAGGVVGEAYATAHHPELGNDHIKLWRLILQHELPKLSKIKGAPLAATESLPVCNDFYDYLFGKRFRSNEF